MSSTFGNKIKLSIFGESHGECIGGVLDGLPAGFNIDMNKLADFMARRAPGGEFVSKRREEDRVKILSGYFNGKTSDAPLCFIIENRDCDSKSYELQKVIPRPGHADYTAYIHSGGFNDYRGGGHMSGRLTAPLCAAGEIVRQMMEKKYGVEISAGLVSVGTETNEELFGKAIEKARAEGDSLGGVIECIVSGVPAGTGEPIFEGLENRISAAVFAVPAVKGIEFGDGFNLAKRKGSECNDCYVSEEGKITTKTNNNGGILGGRASGMPIVFRVAVKPTPSIGIKQESVNLESKENCILAGGGRHDPCAAVRAVPCIEAAASLALADFLL